MKNINLGQIVVALIIGIITTAATIFIYLDEKPRIDATGEYSLWRTPDGINFNGYQSYARVDIRNVGDSAAKDIKLLTPFKGIYSLEDEDIQDFDNNLTLAGLNPGEGHIVEIWARNSLPRFYLNEISVTHTRGTANVDFGHLTKGFVGKISYVLDRMFPFLIILSITTPIMLLIAYLASWLDRRKIELN